MMLAVERVLPSLPMLAQAPHDVLDVDDGVVDHHAKRDHEARQHHRVDRRAGRVEHQPGREQRQRDGDDADQRGAPFVQERDEHQHDQDAAEQQRVGQVVDARPR